MFKSFSAYLENGLRYFNKILHPGRYRGGKVEKIIKNDFWYNPKWRGDRILETGSTYNSDNIRDIIKLSQANLMLSTSGTERKCWQLIVTAAGTGNSAITAKTGSNYNCGTMADSVEDPTANTAFSTTERLP